MPRCPRRVIPDNYYHVLNRASQRARIFQKPADYRAFVRLLADTVETFDLALLSYCVMPSHWHLIVRPVSATQLTTSLHWLTSTHAVRWCRAHTRHGPGPVYQGRYKSIRVQPDFHLLRACRYVERNALKAGLAPRSEDWPWGSASQRARNGNRPRLEPLRFLPPDAWLRCLNESPQDSAFASAVRRDRAFGDDEWVRQGTLESV